MENKNLEINAPINSKINFGQKGFYRVKYSVELMEEIKNNFSELDHLDIWGLYNDNFALCLAQKTELKYYLELVKLYTGEENIIVEEILANFGKLSLLKKIEEVDSTTEEFCKHLLNKFGWEKKEGEKETDGLLRSMVIHKLGRLNNEEVLNKIKKMFESLLNTPESIHPDMRSTIYRIIAWQGNEETYQKLLDLYRKSENPQEKLQLLASLACFKDQTLLQRSLDFALSNEVRHQNIVSLVANVCLNPHGRELVWPWITKNWPKIKEIFSHYVWHFNSILGSLSYLADTALGEDINRFLRQDPIPGTQRALAQTLEKMKIYENFKNNVQT